MNKFHVHWTFTCVHFWKIFSKSERSFVFTFGKYFPKVNINSRTKEIKMCCKLAGNNKFFSVRNFGDGNSKSMIIFSNEGVNNTFPLCKWQLFQRIDFISFPLELIYICPWKAPKIRKSLISQSWKCIMPEWFSDKILFFLSMPRVTLFKYNIIFSHQFFGVANTGKTRAHLLNCQNEKFAENEGYNVFPSNSTM